MTRQAPASARFSVRAHFAPLLFLFLATAATALCGSVAQAQNAPAPWQRTETREACSSFNALRNPYFGETHSHTGLSIDAVIGDDRSGPRDAYKFAKGDVIDLPPYDAGGQATRTARLRRPLDFAAVTDHAEGFDLDYICKTSGVTGYDSTQCTAIRADVGNVVPGYTPHSFFDILLPTVFSLNPQPPDFCQSTPGLCESSASVIWAEEQDAAEAFYDRTAACAFTTFVAYEWSGTPLAQNLHRNIIFRNRNVPTLPISYIEQSTADGLWAELQTQCLNAGNGCDVLAIPHNSNLSNGVMFEAANSDGSPLSATEAATRAAFEPLVEMIQHKGDSECKTGVGTNDELCGFEKVTRKLLFQAGGGDPNQVFPPLLFVRNALKQGLLTEASIGVNPFKLGFVGATDTHNATPGQVEEDNWQGHMGTQEGSPVYRISKVGQAPNIQNNPGGLAVVWAEENSRDALFAAMRRREVYATSGTRPIVRAFAGKLAGSICNGASFAATGYQKGVPMGGELGPVKGNASPAFAVLAMKDSGTPGAPGTPLQRIQIVKGWIDDSGQAQEQVFDITKNPENGATVDTATCQTSGPGSDSLCAVWKDPNFKASQRAFYYARVVENPTCRWSTRICNDALVDCSDPASVPADFAECCDGAIPKTIQERAWTSPFWYEPEGIGKVSASVAFGAQSGTDVFKLSAQIGAAALNPDTDPITVTVRDNDDIYQVTVPAGTMANKGGGKYELKDKTGTLSGLRSIMLKALPTGLRRLVVQTVPMDLSRADRVDHMVEIDLRIGSYHAQHSRLWVLKGTKLQTR